MSEINYLDKIKTAIRTTSTDENLDDELNDLIDAAFGDLGIAGANGEMIINTDPLTIRAVITYCKMNFGEPEDYEKLKASYDEQKAQLSMATGYTIWGDIDAA
jgi:hypothetical protein